MIRIFILSYTAGTSYGQVEQIPSGTSAVFTFDGLIKLVGAFKEDYLHNATFLINRSNIMALRTIKDTTGQYVTGISEKMGILYNGRIFIS